MNNIPPTFLRKLLLLNMIMMALILALSRRLVATVNIVIQFPGPKVSSYPTMATVLLLLQQKVGITVLLGKMVLLRIYNVKFADGHYEQYSTNILAEALASQYDNDGFDTGFISEISGYRKHSNSIPRSQGFFLSNNGNRTPVVTTKGWDHRVTWKDGSSTWVPLSVLKNAEPVLVATYAKTVGIHNEPAYKWWVSHTLNKQSRLISKIKTSIIKTIYNMALKFLRPTMKLLHLIFAMVITSGNALLIKK